MHQYERFDKATGHREFRTDMYIHTTLEPLII